MDADVRVIDALRLAPSLNADQLPGLLENAVAPRGYALVADQVEVSVVMPCLNEAASVGDCVDKALASLRRLGVKGEVVVCDNGSTDGSQEVAQQHGARVVCQPLRGYGNAYMKGFDEARGQYIVMADSDDTYDFDDIGRFLIPLRKGADLVMGNRFAGGIMPGAMTWSHRYIGNPILSGLLNLFFHTGIGDAHSGMRAFNRAAYPMMHLQTGGMEFASEMVINASKAGLRISEIPIKYYPRVGSSKLLTLRDGWRHLRFMLLYSPTHLFLWPGLSMMALGLLAMLVLATGPLDVAGIRFGFHWMFLCALLAIGGFQVISMGYLARYYSLTSHFITERDRIQQWFGQHFTLERGIALGTSLFLVGAILDGVVLLSWLVVASVDLNSIRWSILALTLSIIGIQIIFSSFLASMMAIKRRGWQ